MRYATVTIVLILSTSAIAAELKGRVVGVTDGDTIAVLTEERSQERVRLAGIDAPERRQSYGQVSKQNLSDLVFDRNVIVVWDKRDRYGRIVGKPMVGGRDVGLEQVRAGFAWHYKQYQREQSPADRKLYDEAEKSARVRHIGLWQDEEPMPPWDWRKIGR
jgi:endonuclease YncB( thermonuclease family)